MRSGAVLSWPWLRISLCRLPPFELCFWGVGLLFWPLPSPRCRTRLLADGFDLDLDRLRSLLRFVCWAICVLLADAIRLPKDKIPVAMSDKRGPRPNVAPTG